MNLNIVIPIDDTHPEKGWGMEGDECTNYLIELNKEFGCKFVHFIPSNYHHIFPISQFKDWIDYWNQFDWIELAAHGYSHNKVYPSDDCRECEFIELNYIQSKNRIEEILEEWDKVGIRPKGWRMPGWIATQGAFDAVREEFDYIAIHKDLNNNINLGKHKIFRGENPIHDNSSLLLYDDNLYFQSHISGVYNRNNWTEENYKYFRKTLLALKQEHTISFKTFFELC